MKYLLKIRNLSKNWQFWLLLITGVAIIIRSIPAWTNAAWGCDFGIYYSLTNSFVENKELYNSYYGWGGSYQYFPVLYAVTGIAHWITGIDVLILMPKIAPIFGGLSILIFYFVVNELIGDRKTALLSSIVLAVLPFHAYQTSHASPLTMGHFFMMLCIFLFIKFRNDKRYFIPLIISTLLLIMSHHLTTYFYLLSLVCIIFFENASQKEWTPFLKKDILYIMLASALIFSYWAFIATPVYERFMNGRISFGPFSLGANFTVILFYMLFFSIFLIIFVKRKLGLFLNPHDSSGKSSLIKFILTIMICLSAMIMFSFIKMPWTNFSFTPLSIIYALPMVIVIGFGVAGFRHTRFVRNGFFIRGWLIAILVSFLFGLLTFSWTIYPHRHLEYIMIPLSIISVFGVKRVLLSIQNKSINISKITFFKYNIQSLISSGLNRKLRKRQIIFTFIIVILVASNAVSIYPSHVALNASYEAITNEDLSVIHWMESNLDTKNCVIASDHRLARMAESAGFNTTLDETTIIWYKENLSDFLNELLGVGKEHGRITHIIIDDIMRQKVVHVGFGNIVYMTNESYDKFEDQPFELIYRNVTLNVEMEEIHWTELYYVNWTYIEEQLPFLVKIQNINNN